MLSMKAGESITINNYFVRRRWFKKMQLEGFEVVMKGKEVKVITDRIGLRKNYEV